MHSAVLSLFLNLPTILGKEYKLWSSSFLPSLLSFQVQTFSSALCFQKLNLCSSVRTRNQVSLPHKTRGKTAYTSLLSNACYMSHPPHASSIDYLSNIWWWLQIMNLLITKFSPVTSSLSVQIFFSAPILYYNLDKLCWEYCMDISQILMNELWYWTEWS
jgi:hypothetical protein